MVIVSPVGRSIRYSRFSEFEGRTPEFWTARIRGCVPRIHKSLCILPAQPDVRSEVNSIVLFCTGGIKAVLRIGAAVVLLIFVSSTFAQDAGNQDKDFAVSVDVQLVQLPVSVLDKDGR